MKIKKKELLYINKTDEVNEYMKSLQHPLKAEIEAVRNIIKNANSKIGERIKWNAPSFFYKMDMAAFNPGSQKFVQIIFIFPKGLINYEAGLWQGDWKDRREARFYDKAEVLSKKTSLENFVNNWIAQMNE
ncbi:MAG: DUF1801 domain-containing protein [Chitinophagaceae bacterium]